MGKKKQAAKQAAAENGMSTEMRQAKNAAKRITEQIADVMTPEDNVSDRSLKPAYPRYRVRPGKPIVLADLDPNAANAYQSKKDAEQELEKQRQRLQELQARLFAEQKQSLLIVLQAIDTGGKDGTIKHVFQGVNPQGCQVWSFKQPSIEELNHDFLWRYHQRTPGRGMIAIFNRSHYEDVLVTRVKQLVPEEIW